MIQAVVTDLAGSTIDFGSSAPAGAFVELFRRHNVTITRDQARAPMGLEKRDHIVAILAMDTVAAGWRESHDGSNYNEEDVDNLYAEFIPLQLELLPDFGKLIPGVVDIMNGLMEEGIRIGATTGYNQAMMEVVLKSAAEQGFMPQAAVCADVVSRGRPWPWMIYRIMEKLEIFPPSKVVNIGDTLPDVISGLRAGVWSVGLVASGNMMGCGSAEELAAIEPVFRETKLAEGRQAMLGAGAHYVIDTVADLQPVLSEINERLSKGEMP